MLKKLKDNNQGMVFITVLAFIIVSMVLAVSILSLNISQVNTTETEIRRIQSEMLGLSSLAYSHALQLNGDSYANAVLPTETLGPIDFDSSINIITSGTPPPNSESVPINIIISY